MPLKKEDQSRKCLTEQAHFIQTLSPSISVPPAHLQQYSPLSIREKGLYLTSPSPFPSFTVAPEFTCLLHNQPANILHTTEQYSECFGLRLIIQTSLQSLIHTFRHSQIRELQKLKKHLLLTTAGQLEVLFPHPN